MKILNYRCLLDPKCNFYVEAVTQEGLDEGIENHMRAVNNHADISDKVLDTLDETTTFNLNLPSWMADVLTEEAKNIGISRAALIKVILHNHIKEH